MHCTCLRRSLFYRLKRVRCICSRSSWLHKRKQELCTCWKSFCWDTRSCSGLKSSYCRRGTKTWSSSEHSYFGKWVLVSCRCSMSSCFRRQVRVSRIFHRKCHHKLRSLLPCFDFYWYCTYHFFNRRSYYFRNQPGRSLSQT